MQNGFIILYIIYGIFSGAQWLLPKIVFGLFLVTEVIFCILATLTRCLRKKRRPIEAEEDSKYNSLRAKKGKKGGAKKMVADEDNEEANLGGDDEENQQNDDEQSPTPPLPKKKKKGKKGITPPKIGGGKFKRMGEPEKGSKETR